MSSQNVEANFHSGFERFAHGLKSGDESAAQELFHRYAERLRSIASHRLGNSLRSKVDAEDVIQSVMEDFFEALREGRWELSSSRNLRGLLSLMVTRKCSRYFQRFGCVSRERSRERSQSEQPEMCMSREPSPENAVEAADQIEFWLDQLDNQDRFILRELLAGESTQSIAEACGCSQRTVQRTFRRILMRVYSYDFDAG